MNNFVLQEKKKEEIVRTYINYEILILHRPLTTKENETKLYKNIETR